MPLERMPSMEFDAGNAFEFIMLEFERITVLAANSGLKFPTLLTVTCPPFNS